MYSREIDGNVLTLAASGWTYNFSFVLYDFETWSMWLPVNVGIAVPGCGCVMWCIAGEYFGRILPGLPSGNFAWNVWFGEHPGTKLMVPPADAAE